MSRPTPGAQISDDGSYWWDGNAWQLVDQSAAPAGGDGPANTDPVQPPAGPYHPSTHGDYDPNVHGAFDPSVHGDYHPEVHGQFDPARHGEFDPSRHGAYHPEAHGEFDEKKHGKFHKEKHGAFHPQIHGEFDPAGHGDFDPSVHGDFHPAAHGEYDPARHGEFHQQRHGPHHPDLHGPHDPAIHGELSAERHGEAAAAAAPTANAIEWGSYPTIHALVSTRNFADFTAAVHVAYNEEMRAWDNTAFTSAAMAVESAQASVGNAPVESLDRQQLRTTLDECRSGEHLQTFGEALTTGGHHAEGEAFTLLGQTLGFEVSVL